MYETQQGGWDTRRAAAPALLVEQRSAPVPTRRFARFRRGLGGDIHSNYAENKAFTKKKYTGDDG